MYVKNKYGLKIIRSKLFESSFNKDILECYDFVLDNLLNMLHNIAHIILTNGKLNQDCHNLYEILKFNYGNTNKWLIERC